jgi:hypothetical protein
MGWIKKQVSKAASSATEALKDQVKERLNQSSSTPVPAESEHIQVRTTGFPSREVVGESNYKREISKAVGGRDGEHQLRALLQREPTNKFDPNAIRVVINGATVGYVPRAETSDLQSLLQRAESQGLSIVVPARVYWSSQDGGMGSVSYDLEDPALAWPVNDLPNPEAGSVWPTGRKLKVTWDDDEREAVWDFLDRAYVKGRCGGYVRLSRSETHPNRAAVTFEDRRLGTLSPQASRGMFDIHDEAGRLGRAIWLEAEIVGNRLAAEIRVLVKPAEELSDDEISNLIAGG